MRLITKKECIYYNLNKFYVVALTSKVSNSIRYLPSWFSKYRTFQIKVLVNKKPKGLNGHLSIRDCTDFLSEGFIFAYQQPHHRFNGMGKQHDNP